MAIGMKAVGIDNSLTMFYAMTTSIQHGVQVGMCGHLRFKSVWAPVQSDQRPSFPPEETLDPWLPIECPSKT